MGCRLSWRELVVADSLGLRFQMKLATLLCALERVLTVNWSDAMLPGLLDSRYVGGCMPVIIYSVRGGSDRCSGVMTASVVFLGPGKYHFVSADDARFVMTTAGPVPE